MERLVTIVDEIIESGASALSASLALALPVWQWEKRSEEDPAGRASTEGEADRAA